MTRNPRSVGWTMVILCVLSCNVRTINVEEAIQTTTVSAA
jgi:hypothetical protein